MPTDESSLLALIKLLGDDHAEVVEAARAKLVELGPQVVGILTETAEQHEDPKVRVEARAVLERIRLMAVCHEWKEATVRQDRRMDLEQGAFLVAMVCYPGLDCRPYRQRLDAWADQIRTRLRPAMKPREQLQVINRFLFRHEGFRANWEDYFDPENSYLNRVMDRKLGIPITLSLLYLLVSQRLRIPVRGVGIPGHFMVKYEDGQTELYVDPFNEGRFLSRPQCVQFIVESGYPYQPEFLEGIGPREVLARMLRNLILIYIDRHEQTLERTFNQFLDLLYPAES